MDVLETLCTKAMLTEGVGAADWAGFSKASNYWYCSIIKGILEELSTLTDEALVLIFEEY